MALKGKPDAAKLAALNARLLTAERLLLNDGGLPTRPYYKHMLYAPGLYTGYAPKTVSGIRESIELKDYKLAESEVPRVAKAVNDEAAFVERWPENWSNWGSNAHSVRITVIGSTLAARNAGKKAPTNVISRQTLVAVIKVTGSRGLTPASRASMARPEA